MWSSSAAAASSFCRLSGNKTLVPTCKLLGSSSNDFETFAMLSRLVSSFFMPLGPIDLLCFCDVFKGEGDLSAAGNGSKTEKVFSAPLISSLTVVTLRFVLPTCEISLGSSFYWPLRFPALQSSKNFGCSKRWFATAMNFNGGDHWNIPLVSLVPAFFLYNKIAIFVSSSSVVPEIFWFLTFPRAERNCRVSLTNGLHFDCSNSQVLLFS